MGSAPSAAHPLSRTQSSTSLHNSLRAVPVAGPATALPGTRSQLTLGQLPLVCSQARHVLEVIALQSAPQFSALNPGSQTSPVSNTPFPQAGPPAPPSPPSPLAPAVPLVPALPLAPPVPPLPELPLAPAVPLVPALPLAPAVPPVPAVPPAPACPAPPAAPALPPAPAWPELPAAATTPPVPPPLEPPSPV